MANFTLHLLLMNLILNGGVTAINAFQAEVLHPSDFFILIFLTTGRVVRSIKLGYLISFCRVQGGGQVKHLKILICEHSSVKLLLSEFSWLYIDPQRIQRQHRNSLQVRSEGEAAARAQSIR